MPWSEGLVREDLRRLVQWLHNLHAPLGHAAPLAASALFAAAGLSRSGPLRFLAYGLASGMAILIALDLGRSLLESNQSREERPERSARITVPQLILTSVQASIYTYLIFVGMGPVTPYIFVLPIFAISWLAAWRNVRLWYRQGMDYADHLKEAAEIENLRLERAHWRDNER